VGALIKHGCKAIKEVVEGWQWAPGNCWLSPVEMSLESSTVSTMLYENISCSSSAVWYCNGCDRGTPSPQSLSSVGNSSLISLLCGREDLIFLLSVEIRNGFDYKSDFFESVCSLCVVKVKVDDVSLTEFGKLSSYTVPSGSELSDSLSFWGVQLLGFLFGILKKWSLASRLLE
jgi:hypothetical protein